MIEEVLFPQRMLLARHIPTAHSIARAAATTTTATASRPRKHARARPRIIIRIGVLGSRSHIGSTAQQLIAILTMQHIVARGLERVKFLAILGKLGAEIPYALVGLLLLCWVEFLLGERVVLVDSFLEGGQGCGEGAEGRGAEDGGGGGGWVGRVGRGGSCEGLRGEVGEVSADRGALFQSTVECCVLCAWSACDARLVYKVEDVP